MADPTNLSIRNVDFANLLKNKNLQIVTLKFMTSNQWRPDSNRNYMILGGTLNHVTGTASELQLLSSFTNGVLLEYLAVIPAATGSIYSELFAGISGLGTWHPIIIPAGSDMSLYFTGDAAAFVNVTMLMW